MVTHGCMRRCGKSFPTVLLLLVAAVKVELELVCTVYLCCLIRRRLLLLPLIHAVVDYT